jgi:hypothetical protein
VPSISRPRRRPQDPQGPRGSRSPHSWPPESLHAKALRLAVQLTPFQRSLVARAGLPRWLELPLPFSPHPGRPLAAARVLASAEYGLLEPVPTLPGRPLAYQLTLLGELVAGLWLTAALCDVEPLPMAPAPLVPPFPPSHSF